MIDKTNFAEDTADFFISNSGILQLIQKVQFHLSSLGKDHFMCH